MWNESTKRVSKKCSHESTFDKSKCSRPLEPIDLRQSCSSQVSMQTTSRTCIKNPSTRGCKRFEKQLINHSPHGNLSSPLRYHNPQPIRHSVFAIRHSHHKAMPSQFPSVSFRVPSVAKFYLCLAAAVAPSARADEKPFPKPANSQEETIKPLTPEEALKALQLPPGFKATLFAAEPAVQQPIAMAWDERGRLWVAECYTYAESAKGFDKAQKDRIIILEDTDGDGQHDKRTVFSDKGDKLTSIEIG